jgi:hypothetical protein
MLPPGDTGRHSSYPQFIGDLTMVINANIKSDTCQTDFAEELSESYPEGLIPVFQTHPRTAQLLAALAHPTLFINFSLDIIIRVIEAILRDPYFPPCPGAVIGARSAGWRCFNGKVSFVDRVAWRCPDGRAVLKEAASIVTDQAC